MAKKKAELEEDAACYYTKLDEMRIADDRRDYYAALSSATAAWEYVDGMMQFERRFEDRVERKSLECVDYVLRYAPLVFGVEALTSLSALLRTQKRIDKGTSASIAAGLQNANSLMHEAHRLWDLLERDVELDQDKLRRILGGEQDLWRELAEKWEFMGFVRRVPRSASYTISLMTRMEDEVRAKCSSCGVIAKAAKGRFWEPITCPKCKSSVYFVILTPGKS